MWRRQHHGRMQFLKQTCAVFKKLLPARVLQHFASYRHASIEVWVSPNVTDLVDRRSLRPPQSYDFGVLLTHFQHAGEELEPARDGAGSGTVAAKLVDVGRLHRGLRWTDLLQQTDILADQVRAELRDVLGIPARARV